MGWEEWEWGWGSKVKGSTLNGGMGRKREAKDGLDVYDQGSKGRLEMVQFDGFFRLKCTILYDTCSRSCPRPNIPYFKRPCHPGMDGRACKMERREEKEKNKAGRQISTSFEGLTRTQLVEGNKTELGIERKTQQTDTRRYLNSNNKKGNSKSWLMRLIPSCLSSHFPPPSRHQTPYCVSLLFVWNCHT